MDNNENKEQQQRPQPKGQQQTFGGGTKGSSTWLWIIIVGLVLLVVSQYLNIGGTEPTTIASYKFEEHLASGEITEVVKQGNWYYGYKDGGPITVEGFSTDLSKAKYKTYYTSTNWDSEFFKTAGVADASIPWATWEVTTNIWEIIFSWLPTVLIILLVFFLLSKMLRSSNSGLGNMGRNRARVVRDSKIRFADVAGIEEEKAEVEEIVDFLKNPKKYLSLGARIPKGFLLVGAPGTGKTLLAKAIAGEAGVPFFSISGSDFSEMLVGVGPSRMRDLFETAKLNTPCIVFIDEIDSIARMRGVGASGVSDENEQTLNQLLVQMDGFSESEGVIVMAATNRPDVLDQALLRPGRFDRQIIVQMPDVKGREKILAVHSRKKPMSDDVDLSKVAKIISGFSGADIENLMNESAILAAKKNHSKITMADVTEGINKVLLGPQKRSRIITEGDKKITAFHEAGHAIVSKLLETDNQVTEVSVIPRGRAAGYTLTNTIEEKMHVSKKQLINRLTMLLAGRGAELLMIGDICTGSQNDLKTATGIAEKMVTDFGMSDKIGAMFYGKDDEIVIRMYNQKNHSESLQSVIDLEVKNLITAAEKLSTELLIKNKAKLQVMADVLLEKETIYSDDIELIMNGKDKKAVIVEMEKREAAHREQVKKDEEARKTELEAQENQFNEQIQKVLVDAGIIKQPEATKIEEQSKIEATPEGTKKTKTKKE